MRSLRVMSIFFLVLLLGGCCGGQRHPWGRIIGTYVRQPQEGERGFSRREFQCGWQECFDHVRDILKNDLGVTVSLADKNRYLISATRFDRIYPSCTEATEVYIYTRPAGAGMTAVEVTCGNYGLSRFAAEAIYTKLEERLNKEAADIIGGNE